MSCEPDWTLPAAVDNNAGPKDVGFGDVADPPAEALLLLDLSADTVADPPPKVSLKAVPKPPPAALLHLHPW